MKVGQSITLDFTLQNHIKLIAKQNDINSRYLNIILCNNRQPVTLSNNATATLNITRCDGAKNSYMCHIEDNVISVYLSKWAVELEGVLLCDVSVMEDNERLTTMSFKVMVHANCCTTDDIIDDDSEDLITGLVSTVADHTNAISSMVDDYSGLWNRVAEHGNSIGELCEGYNSLNVTVAEHSNSISELCGGYNNIQWLPLAS